MALDQLRAYGVALPAEREIYLTLRRRVGRAVLVEILDSLNQEIANVSVSSDLTQPQPGDAADNLSASDAHPVEHYQKSETIGSLIGVPSKHHANELSVSGSLRSLTFRTCSDALAWLREGETQPCWSQIVRKAGLLASWIGISSNDYDQAVARLGSERVASTVLWLVQCGNRIERPPAYFRSVTTGRRASSFSVERALGRLGARKHAL